MPDPQLAKSHWRELQQLSRWSFLRGYCGRHVASDKGYQAQNPLINIFVCPNCQKPTFVALKTQVPAPAPGNDVEFLPGDVSAIYSEARRCLSVEANTASVLASRKLLMNIAVSRGAPPNKTFAAYVDYLVSAGFVPPDGKGWVDHIRTKGNEATHELTIMSREDAEELVAFSEMLLRFIYELPNRLSKPMPP